MRGSIRLTLRALCMGVLLAAPATLLAQGAATPVSPDTLRAFLTEPHRPMPDLSLSRQEILDLTAYIQSL